MPKRTPGSLNAPPPQAVFDRLPLSQLTAKVSGIFHRLHTLNPATGQPWGPLHFSQRGTTRFDPTAGLGTLYVAETLAGGLSELFDDLWGPVGNPSRSLRTSTNLQNSWVTAVDLPAVKLFDATGPNLSKIGTDGQVAHGRLPDDAGVGPAAGAASPTSICSRSASRPKSSSKNRQGA